MLSLPDIKHRHAIVRVGYDVSDLHDTTRIEDSVDTIKTLLENHNRVVLLTHWGRPQGEVTPSLSIRKLHATITQVFHQHGIDTPLKFLDQFLHPWEEILATLQHHKDKYIYLLENVRFDPREQSPTERQRQKLAEDYMELGDCFIDEAFNVSHRQHASNYHLKQLLPNAQGNSYQQETEQLDYLTHQPDKPFVVVMAGAKLQTKLPIIEHMVSIADYILIGGLLAFTFHAAAKQYGLPLNQQANPTYPELYDSHIETDFLDRAAELLRQYPQKIVLPIDFQVGNLFDKQEILDVGPQTIALFQRRLAMAKTIFWNGTLGYYEHPDYAHGTLQLAKTTSQLSSYKVIGGGDTHNALPPDILDTFNFVSMGGGATLEYLAKHSPE